MNRRALMTQAVQAACDARDSAGFDLVAPLDIYALAEALGIRVRFLDVSMEGFYQRGTPPRIMLSALRPVARRAFTCAHEVGHHWFGHGSRIDELQADERSDSDIPEEILANGFASFILMPTIGLRRAFNSRGWTPAQADPVQMLTVASEFGVGYSTLITHLALTLREISAARRAELERWTPQRIRRHIFPDQDLDGLIILDEHQLAASADVQVGYGVATPKGAKVVGEALEHTQSHLTFELYRAVRRGLASVSSSRGATDIRVAPEVFIGPANYRFLEDPDE